MPFFLKVCNFKDLGPIKFRPQRALGNLKVWPVKVNGSYTKQFKQRAGETTAALYRGYENEVGKHIM
jgi:hypothetical protein